MNKNLIVLSWTAGAIAGGISLFVHIRETARRRKLEKLELEVRRTMTSDEWQKRPFVDRMEYLFDAQRRAEKI